MHACIDCMQKRKLCLGKFSTLYKGLDVALVGQRRQTGGL